MLYQALDVLSLRPQHEHDCLSTVYTGTCFSTAASVTPAFNSCIGSPQQITGTPLILYLFNNVSTMLTNIIPYFHAFFSSMCKIYNSIVSIIFFNESADSLSFNASSPLKLIGISDSIPSAPTIAGILNDTPSISYTP